jgi:hypothetical protein
MKAPAARHNSRGVRTVLNHSHRCILLLATLCILFSTSGSSGLAAEWQSTLTRTPPAFPPPRPLRATYVFGWGGFTAATSEVHFTKPSEDRFQLEGAGRTTGLARALWKLDANGRAVADAGTLYPVEVRQTETYRAKKVVTSLRFSNSGVRSERTENATAKNFTFDFPGLFDLHSALLYLRGQPLKDGKSYCVVVYPAKNAYLTTVTVVGREKISVRAGKYDAIKLDLKLSRIGKNLELETYKKVRRASIWISDDNDRILLRIEAQIAVGTVFTELQSVQFEN